MIAVNLNEVELLESWQAEDPSARTRAAFPLVGVPDTGALGVVYFEVEPGNALGTHTDSQDEIVVLLSGAGEGTVGDDTGQVSAGALLFIPAMVPHGFRNTGDETLRAVGIFAGANCVSSFEHVLQPMGVSVIEHQALAIG
jgi:quercetin dioxygenase-like cupin family protein